MRCPTRVGRHWQALVTAALQLQSRLKARKQTGASLPLGVQQQRKVAARPLLGSAPCAAVRLGSRAQRTTRAQYRYCLAAAHARCAAAAVRKQHPLPE